MRWSVAMSSEEKRATVDILSEMKMALTNADRSLS